MRQKGGGLVKVSERLVMGGVVLVSERVGIEGWSGWNGQRRMGVVGEEEGGGELIL